MRSQRATSKIIRILLARLPLLRGLQRRAFVAGLLAGIPFLILTLLLRLLGLGVFLPEVAVEAVAATIPGTLESFLIHNLGEGAKYLGLAIALVVVVLLHGVVGLAYPLAQRRLQHRYRVMAVFVVAPLALALLVALPLLAAGVAGSTLPQGPFAATFSLLLGYLLFAAFLDYLNVDFRASHPQGFNLSRRGFLKLGAVLAFGVVISALGLQRLASQPGRTSFASFEDVGAHEVTSNEDFYIVTKNVIDPTVDATTWQLTVAGAVDRTFGLTYDELRARIDTTEYVTLECVSNEVGGNLISNAQWRGVRLAALLGEAGVRPEATWVAFECADGYTVGLPMALAMDPATLVALEMNGEPLPQRHGFPARIVVPGRYGMFHAKWVTSITLVSQEFKGFWQGKGWTNQGDVKTTAIILTPPPETVVSTAVTIGGIAFAGRWGISRVEVSTDGGSSWREAGLGRSGSPYTWAPWSLPWVPTEAGSHRIVARAWDGDGNPQEVRVAPPFPEGSSGYDSIHLIFAP